MKVLWLASWYPDPYEPSNGDFIQRHAEAVAAIIPIDLIHVLQAGHKVQIEKELQIVNRRRNLTEYIYAFEFKTSGNKVLDLFRYNIRYINYYKKIISVYFKTHGRPDLIHVHVPVKAGLAALYVLKEFHVPYIVSEQSSHYEETSPEYFSKRSKYFRYNTKRIFENAIAVTNVSETIGKKLQSLFDIKNYCTIHNLVNTELFNYKPNVVSNKVRFIHVSAMGEQKNPDGIIEALALMNKSFTNWECKFCGPHNSDIESLVKEKQLENKIRFTGEIKYEEVATEMQQSDVFVLFSNHENFPCVIVEALCCGLLIIASDAGGICEAVNGSNGLLVKKENVQGLADALLKIATNIDKYDGRKISENAIALYNKKRIADQFVDLYKSIIVNSKNVEV